MQQRQLRLGDILDDYCPRERRVTNHVIVAMIAEDVKQVRCTTCDADHEFKHAKVPRQRRKAETPAALYTQVLASGPKRVTPDVAHPADAAAEPDPGAISEQAPLEAVAAVLPRAPIPEPRLADVQDVEDAEEVEPDEADRRDDEGPVHRPLIRASLPKIDGAPPPTRQIP